MAEPTSGPIKILFSTSDTWSLYFSKDLTLFVDGQEVATNGKPVLVKGTGFVAAIDGTTVSSGNEVTGYFTRYHHIRTDGTVTSPEYGPGSGPPKP